MDTEPVPLSDALGKQTVLDGIKVPRGAVQRFKRLGRDDRTALTAPHRAFGHALWTLARDELSAMLERVAPIVATIQLSDLNGSWGESVLPQYGPLRAGWDAVADWWVHTIRWPGEIWNAKGQDWERALPPWFGLGCIRLAHDFVRNDPDSGFSVVRAKAFLFEEPDSEVWLSGTPVSDETVHLELCGDFARDKEESREEFVLRLMSMVTSEILTRVTLQAGSNDAWWNLAEMPRDPRTMGSGDVGRPPELRAVAVKIVARMFGKEVPDESRAVKTDAQLSLMKRLTFLRNPDWPTPIP
jgi:hypothetical protein